MNFLDNINEKKNKFLEEVYDCCLDQSPLYIVGGGKGGEIVADFLTSVNINFSGIRGADNSWT